MRSRRCSSRLLSLFLVLALLTGGLSGAAQAQAVSSGGADAIQVVYIPVDDRPFHDQRARLMADSLGIELIMPGSSLYQTRLDGQAAGSSQYGNRGALIAWLKQQAGQYDTFVISLDQLLSGGLMNSRCMDKMETIYVPGGDPMTEYDVIDYLSELSRTKEVYIIDSVLRLACSCNYRGYSERDYSVTRAYGMLPRFVLGGDALTVDNILRYYRSINTVFSGYAELIDKYLAVRERKLRLSDYAVRSLAGQSNVHYLLGVDDSSPGNNVQSNEISYLQQFLGGNDLTFSAVDGLAQAALARIYTLHHKETAARVSIHYYGSSPKDVGIFNCFSNETMLAQEIPYFGGEIVTEDPEVSVVVVSAPEDSVERDSAYLSAVSRLNENEADHIPTILIDLTETDQDHFHQLLTENVHLGYLLSYSGYYERPVQVTMAVSQGLARYHSLSPSLTGAQQESHLENLLGALVKDFYKTGPAGDAVSRYLTKEGLSANNFAGAWTSKQIKAAEVMTSALQEATGDLMENFRSSNLVLCRQPYQEGNITRASLGKCIFPWLRTFEIDCQISCGYGTEPYAFEFIPAYIDGMPDGTFSPDGSLTRNQAAKLLIVAEGQTPAAGDACPFSDVPDWAKGYVQAAYLSGYVKGYADDVFRGGASMTRAEFAALLTQYMEANGIELPKTPFGEFTDLPRASDKWYTEAVYLLADSGLTSGYEDGAFRPSEPITRVEAAAMLSVLFSREADMPAGLLSAQRFSDVPATHWAYVSVQAASISRFRAA